MKKAILHRRNSLFFKTQNGARVGDLFLSLIHTAELSNVNPHDYLIQLLSNKGDLDQHPATWMPWTYNDSLNSVAS